MSKNVFNNYLSKGTWLSHDSSSTESQQVKSTGGTKWTVERRWVRTTYYVNQIIAEP